MSNYSATRRDENGEQKQLHQVERDKGIQARALEQEARQGPTVPPVAQKPNHIGAFAIRGPEASLYMGHDAANESTAAAPNNAEQLCVAAEVAPHEGDLEACIDSRIAAQLNRMTVNATNVASLEEEEEHSDKSGGERRVCSSKRVGIILGVLLLLVVGVIVAVVVPLTSSSSRNEKSELLTGSQNVTSTPTTNLPDNSPSSTDPTVTDPPPSETTKPSTGKTLPPDVSSTTLPPTDSTSMATEGAASCDFDILEETGLYWSSIANAIPLTVPFDDAVEECKAICSILPACVAFTVWDVGTHSLNNVVPWCFVKYSIPPETNVQDITSGIKNTGSGVCSFPESTYDELPSTLLLGRDLIFLCIPLGFVSTLDEATGVCRDVCSAMSNCKAFSAFDPRIDIIVFYFTCCIKNGVPAHDVGAELLANSGIKL